MMSFSDTHQERFLAFPIHAGTNKCGAAVMDPNSMWWRLCNPIGKQHRYRRGSMAWEHFWKCVKSGHGWVIGRLRDESPNSLLGAVVVTDKAYALILLNDIEKSFDNGIDITIIE